MPQLLSSGEQGQPSGMTRSTTLPPPTLSAQAGDTEDQPVLIQGPPPQLLEGC